MSGDVQARVAAVLAAHDLCESHVGRVGVNFSCGFRYEFKDDDSFAHARRAHVAAAIAADLDAAGGDGLRAEIEGLADEAEARKAAYPEHPDWTAWDMYESDLRAALAAQPAPADDEGGVR